MQRRLLLHGILNRNVEKNIGIRATDSLSWVHTSLPPLPPPDTTTTTVATSSPSHKKEELDFWKAADILFSEAPKQKKFGYVSSSRSITFFSLAHNLHVYIAQMTCMGM
jgi:hypothetical protein